MRNTQAAGDARHARTGKDGALFDLDGTLLATVESFVANVTYNNSKYSVMGDAQEHETPNTFAVNLQFSQVVVEDDKFIQELITAMDTQIMPSWNFQGSLLGLEENSEERVAYYDCVPSGQIDIQNVAVGDVIKRNWNLFVNRAPKLLNKLTVTRKTEETTTK